MADELRNAAMPSQSPKKNCKRGVLGRICWCVACYDVFLMFNCVFLAVDVLCVGGSGVFGVLTFLGQMVLR